MWRHDHDEFFIEKIIAHEGDFKELSNLSFLVRWLSYSEEDDTYESWATLRNSGQLHASLHSIGKSSVIPKQK